MRHIAASETFYISVGYVYRDTGNGLFYGQDMPVGSKKWVADK
jgi:hypothetical protein